MELIVLRITSAVPRTALVINTAPCVAPEGRQNRHLTGFRRDRRKAVFLFGASCPLLALSGHALLRCISPLSGAEQTSSAALMQTIVFSRIGATSRFVQ